MVRDGTPPPFGDRASLQEPASGDAAVSAPLTGGTTSGLTAIDRARRGEHGAVRVLVVGDGGAASRLALAARTESFATTTTTATSAEAALADAHPHAVIIDAHDDACNGALVARLVAAAPAVPIVVVGPDGGAAVAWIDAGADEHVDEQTVTPALLRRAVESAVARARARELRRRLEHADRLTTIGQLAAGVAHEVNNPAAFLLMNLRTCREYLDELRETIGGAPGGRGADEGDSDGAPGAGVAQIDEMAEMLDDNVRGVERIVAIVEALRGYVRVDGEQPASIDVADVCRDAAGLLAARIRQHARLDLSLDGGGGARVHADPRRLVQVVVNLLANAADACEAAGDRAPPAGHRVAISIVRRGEHVAIRVTDTGIGMSPSVRARVFEPFFTTKPRGRGTGLGLAIVHDIVERFGGSIDVDSEPERGSRFEVLLPIDPTATIAIADGSGGGAAAVAAATRRRVRVRLLLIDDEAALATALSRQLRRYHDVTVATDGATAIELADRDRFDVVLCDVNMPGVDGLGVHAALERRRSHLAPRMIFMTGGLFGDGARAQLAAIGATVLGKPLALSPLLDAIDAARAR